MDAALYRGGHSRCGLAGTWSFDLRVDMRPAASGMIRVGTFIYSEILLYLGVFGYFYYLAGRVPFNVGASPY